MTALSFSDDALREIEDVGPRPEFAPLTFGPVWRRDEDGDFALPDVDLTGGVQVVGWCADYLRGPNGPWSFTFEQLRFVLWYYAVNPVDLDDEDASIWMYSDAVIQKVKGWG